MCMSSMIFNVFIGFGMVENHYLDTKIMTLSSLLRKLQLFFSVVTSISTVIGSHFGGHLGFSGQLHVVHSF